VDDVGADRSPSPVTASPRHLVTLDDLTDADIDFVLRRAGSSPDEQPRSGQPRILVGLLFLTSSLRTRVGFAAAAARLGGSHVDIQEARFGPGMSQAERFSDTLRCVAGMVDLTVVRAEEPLPQEVLSAPGAGPVINGGDGQGHHPTQALIDLASIEQERGPIGGLRVGVCGDPRTRTARSLLALLDRRPPRRLVLMAPANLEPAWPPSGGPLATVMELRHEADFTGIDVLYLAGFPAGTGTQSFTASERAALSLDVKNSQSLRSDAIVLSPMPVIDEIADELRSDPRIRMFEQSDRGVAVRAACVEWCLGVGP
jgi:aspartate carbamoyltransferase catalytic subunit